MATITKGGIPTKTYGNLPEVGSQAPDFTVTKTDLSETSLKDYAGKRVVLNIFPSVDTGTCAASVRHFNQAAAGLDNTVVIGVSRDTPFALKRFCGAEGIENVVTTSELRELKFGEDYGVRIMEGTMKSMLSRAIVVIDENGKVIYTEQVPELGQEPNYDSALNSLK